MLYERACTGRGEIFSYRDERSAEIAPVNAEVTYQVCGVDVESGWLQIWEPSGAKPGNHGFLNAFGGILESVFKTELYQVAVAPGEDELGDGQAYERAIACLLSGEGDEYGFMQRLPEALRSESGLRSMTSDVRLIHEPKTGQTYWWITFTDPDDDTNNVSIDLTPQGELLVVSRSNG